MTTEIMKSFGSLQDELEKAKDNLKAMDEHIKKLTGRDPSDMQMRPGMKRPANAPEEFRGRGRGFPLGRGRPGARPEEEEPPTAKKRPGDTRTVFSRLSGPPRSKREGDSDVEDELPNKPAVSSRVIATPKEPPSRQEAMAAQNKDEQSKQRNRRMFGALLGTLQKFRQEETRMREKEEKRAKVERKLEENAKREKEELKRERQEMFLERKRKQAEIRKIELKMLRIKEQDEWEAKHRNLLNFIQTRTKPHIFYLPKVHNPKTEERLVASQKVVAKMIEKKRQDVRMELEVIEKRGRWRQGLPETGAEPGPASDDEQPLGLDLGDKENRLERPASIATPSLESAPSSGTAAGPSVCKQEMELEDGELGPVVVPKVEPSSAPVPVPTPVPAPVLVPSPIPDLDLGPELQPEPELEEESPMHVDPDVGLAPATGPAPDTDSDSEAEVERTGIRGEDIVLGVEEVVAVEEVSSDVETAAEPEAQLGSGVGGEEEETLQPDTEG